MNNAPVAGSAAGQKKTLWLIAAAVLIVGLGFGAQFLFGGFSTYRDTLNGVEFKFPQAWRVTHSEKFVKVLSNPIMPEELNVLIKVDQPQFFVDILKLGEGAERTMIGEKDLAISHMSGEIPATSDAPTSTYSYTHLYWKDQNGRGYIFEISPWQKDGMDKNLERLISSFKAL